MPRCLLLIGKRVRRQPLPEPEIIPLVSSSPRKTCNSRRRCTPACSAATPAAASRLGKTVKHLRSPYSPQGPLRSLQGRRQIPQRPRKRCMASRPISYLVPRRLSYSTTCPNPVAGSILGGGSSLRQGRPSRILAVVCICLLVQEVSFPWRAAEIVTPCESQECNGFVGTQLFS